MTNKKKILIETLHGSVAQLNELSSMTEGIDIYDDTGHVDTDFLIEAISCVSAFMDASNIVVEKISSLLAPDVPIAEKKKQADEGKKWSVEEILKHCTLEDGVLKLPQVQFNKKSYAEAKKWCRLHPSPSKRFFIFHICFQHNLYAKIKTKRAHICFLRKNSYIFAT